MAIPFTNPLFSLLPDGGIYDPETSLPLSNTLYIGQRNTRRPSDVTPTRTATTIDGYDITSPSVTPASTTNVVITPVNPVTPTGGAGLPTGGNANLPTGANATANRNAREFLIAALRPYFASASDAGFLKDLEGIIDDYIKQDYDVDTISVLLPQTKPYKERFAGNEQLTQAGMAPLSPAEYLQAESQYDEILRRFNLSDLAKRDTFSTLIGGRVSAAELTDRVVNVYDRIRNADPVLRAELNRLASIGDISDVDFVKALLTGTEGANELKRKITTAEISAEARQRGLSTARAQELEQLGVTREQARAGFEVVSQAQPTFEKLAGIYDREKLAPETSQTELEREVFQGMQSQRRRRLAEQEQAAFSGASGLAGQALSTQRAGQL